MIYRAVHFRCADLNEALEPVALHQLFAQPRQRHRIGLEKAPGIFPGNGTLALGREIHDDFRLLVVEKLKQQIEFMGNVARVIDITFALVDVQRERLRPKRRPTDADHLLRVGVIEQVERGMDAEAAAPAQDCISLSSHSACALGVGLRDNRPIIVAAVARLCEQSLPTVRVIVKFRSENPALENLFLFRRVKTINLHEGAVPRNPLDLLHDLERARPWEIVNRVQADHTIEAVIRKRQLFGSAKMQATDDLRLEVHKRVKRDIEAEDFEPRTDLHQILDQKPFRATNVQHAHARLEIEMGNDIARHWDPASIVAVAAIAEFARPVEIDLAKLLGDRDRFGTFSLSALLNVAFYRRQGAQ